MAIVIGIAGAHSGVGKTLIGCRILSALGPRWGAIKCTPTGLYASVTTDPVILAEPGKDTARYLQAGAAEVVWVQGPPDELAEPLELAMSRLGGCEVIVLEGNSAIELVKPDIVIFILGYSAMTKPSALKLLNSADVVIYTVRPPEGDCKSFFAGDTASYTAYITEAVIGRSNPGRA